MAGAPERVLRTTRGELALGGRMWLMGIVNATPDSFSDAIGPQTVEARVALAAEQLAAGAQIIDIGGESAVTNRPAVAAQEEIERVAPVIERVVAELDAIVSVDTYKPEVARAAIAAGAAIVNDVSALRDPALAQVCAQTGAGLVVMHTRAAPKQRLHDRGMDDRILADVHRLLEERIAQAVAAGVAPEQLLLDPGPDFAKTPYQSIQVLRSLSTLHSLGRPLLLAVSRKDFVGAITGRRPRERLAGTLAALGWGADAGAHIARVHDVAAAADFLDVRGTLHGEIAADPDLVLEDRLRWETGPVGDSR